MNRPLQEPKDMIWQQRRGRTPSDHEYAIGEALMCVMLGAPKPQTPTYPADHPLARVKR